MVFRVYVGMRGKRPALRVSLRRYLAFDVDDVARLGCGARSGQPRTESLKHEDPVISASFSADGMFRVVTASWDKTERVWDIASDQSSTPLRVTKRKKAYVKKRVPNGVTNRGHVLTYDSAEKPS